MKIALVSYEYPPETGFGGIATYAWYQARALARAGHEVHVLAGAAEPTALRCEEHDGVTVFRYRADVEPRLLSRGLGRLGLRWTQNRWQNGISMQLGLQRLLAREPYDIVEMPECGADGLRIAGRIDAPTVIRLHSPARLIMADYGASRLDRALCAHLEQTALRRATTLISCSAFLAREARDVLGVRRPIEVIHNGIDVTLFDAEDPVDAREQFGVPRDRPIVLFAGRLERRKGIHVLKEVAARVLAEHEVAFVFAGEDKDRYAETEITPFLAGRTLKGSCHFTGRLEPRIVRSCMRQADVFVIPSLWENCPYSCVEAMAAGCAVVASDVGGLPELIEDGVEGLLAPVEDVEATAACIDRLLRDPALRRRCGRAARRRVEQSLTDDRMARRTVAHYETVIASSR